MAEYLAGLGFGLAFGAIVLILVAVGSLSNTVSRLERKVDALLRHSGVDISEVATTEARRLLGAGKKVAAIKVYRQHTGCGLAEAKAKVESLQQSA